MIRIDVEDVWTHVYIYKPERRHATLAGRQAVGLILEPMTKATDPHHPPKVSPANTGRHRSNHLILLVLILIVVIVRVIMFSGQPVEEEKPIF